MPEFPLHLPPGRRAVTTLLLCRSGNDAGLAHRIGGGRCVVGRGTEASFALLHPDLSREHCLVSERPGVGWVVEDLKSKNGTFLNGQRVSAGEARLLRHCDFLTLGNDLEFVFLDLAQIPASEVVAAALIGPDGERVPLSLGDNLLGSHPDCDLIVEDKAVQERHLKLVLTATELRAESLPGAAPFRVHGHELTAASLAPGDLLVLSGNAEFGVDVVLGESSSGAVPAAQATWRARPPKPEDTASSRGQQAVSRTDQTRLIPARLLEGGDSTASLPASDLAASLQKARERHAQRQAGKENETTGGFGARQAQAEHEDAVGLRRTWAAKQPPGLPVAPAQSNLRAARREAAARIHLVFKGERGPEERVTLLREGKHVIGRQEDCRVWVSDLSVSRHHAEIHVGPQGIVVKDLNSANGTWHDERRISELKVQPGIRVRFGNVTAWFDEI